MASTASPPVSATISTAGLTGLTRGRASVERAAGTARTVAKAWAEGSSASGPSGAGVATSDATSKGELGTDRRTATGRTRDAQPTADSGDPVVESSKS